MVPLPTSAAAATWSTVTASMPCFANNLTPTSMICRRVRSFFAVRRLNVTTVIYDYSHINSVKPAARSPQRRAASRPLPGENPGRAREVRRRRLRDDHFFADARVIEHLHQHVAADTGVRMRSAGVALGQRIDDFAGGG